MSKPAGKNAGMVPVTDEVARAVQGGGHWELMNINGKLEIVWVESITVNG